VENPKDIKQHDAQRLADGYSPLVRFTEVSSVMVFLGGEAFLAYKIWPFAGLHPIWVWFVAAISAYVFADFISGLFHWMGDTWGSPDMPVLGKVFVRPFREHHVDQLAITRHDFLEVNGANCLIALPPLASLHLITLDAQSPLGVLSAGFFGIFLFWIFLTNQFHMWAHTENRPKLVIWAQRWHLILPKEHHQIHHAAPYMKYYCITNGWLNAPLHHLRFFRIAERVISALTGLIPREDDIGENAARKTR
jgi:hypothetical protein